MSEPKNLKLYEEVKRYASTIYKKPSAYKSGFIVKRYKQLGGTYKQANNTEIPPLERWFKEKWTDVNPNKTKTSYPVYRPTIKINSKTPKTKDEIPLKRLIFQSKLKQTIKGSKNLPKF
jgi:hypothetical protein